MQVTMKIFFLNLFLILHFLFLFFCSPKLKKDSDTSNLLILMQLLKMNSANEEANSSNSLPDTGQTLCYNATVQQTCPVSGFPNQDAELDSGIQLSQTDSSQTVTDSKTKLVHTKCALGLSGSNCTTGSATTYNWINASTACTNHSLASKTWRLPSIKEINYITNFGKDSPALDTAFFTNANYVNFWSSDSTDATNAWYSEIQSGYLNPNQAKGTLFTAICVSGSSITPSTYTDNSDQTISDNMYKLDWTKCSAGLSGSNCSTGSATNHTWAQSLQYCDNLTLAGKSDWRLPNIRELYSLVVISNTPKINSSFFPNTPTVIRHFSSTTVTATPANAWGIDFSDGIQDNNVGKTTVGVTKCVRQR